MGKLRLGTKSDIVSCLEELITTPKDATMPDIQPDLSLGVPTVDVVILDGAVIVNMLKPVTARTFSEYGSMHPRYLCHTSQHSSSMRIG